MSTSSAPLVRSRSSRANGAARTPVRPGSALAVPNINPARDAAGTIEVPLPSPEHLAMQGRVFDILDKTVASANPGGHGVVVRDVIEAMRQIRMDVAQQEWGDVVLPAARGHESTSVVYECPLIAHSFSRPRGYPGDAGLLDLIYRHDAGQPAVNAATPVGQEVFGFTINVSACEAVRQRRSLLAHVIDDVAAKRPGAEMLAVACGHLREAELSRALAAGQVGRFVASDQDEDSLAVAAGYAASVSACIETRKLSVRDFIAAKQPLGQFDLVYAAGLYDYLDDRIAARLTRKLFSLLKPGGRLLVANFLTGIWEASFMEVYMDWHLLYRTREQIEAFANEISDVDIASRRYFDDVTGCIGYLELERA